MNMGRKLIVVATVLLAYVAGSVLAAAAPAHAGSGSCPAATLILSAYPEESAAVERAIRMDPTVVVRAGSTRFYGGTVAGARVFLGTTGIGVANAERATRAALAAFTCESAGYSISRIVFSGTAGGGEPARIGDVAVPELWYLGRDDRDPYRVDERLLAIARESAIVTPLARSGSVGDLLAPCGTRLPEVRTVDLGRRPELIVDGSGLTTDPYGGRSLPGVPAGGPVLGTVPCEHVTPERIREDFAALATTDPSFLPTLLAPVDPGVGFVVSDQESAAVAKVAGENRVGFIAFRGISDGAGDPLLLPPFPVSFLYYQRLAAENAATATVAFLGLLISRDRSAAPAREMILELEHAR